MPSNMLLLSLCLVASLSQAFLNSFAQKVTVKANGESVTSLKMGVQLADLPYDYNALEPFIGEKTLRIHHGKHHAKCMIIFICNILHFF